MKLFLDYIKKIIFGTTTTKKLTSSKFENTEQISGLIMQKLELPRRNFQTIITIFNISSFFVLHIHKVVFCEYAACKKEYD